MFHLVLVTLVSAPCAMGHGYLVYPPARNSMWREGFDTPKNWNDMGLNCGGAYNQWEAHNGECGMCGDPVQNSQPRDHEAGGKYAPITRPISRCYNTIDNVIDITVKLTAYHKGYFEFRLCVNNDMTSDPGNDCLENGYLLNVAGMPGVTRYDINEDKREFYDFQLDMPQGVVCTQCIMQWKYTAGNNWGCNEDGCGNGKGNQEQFINCADIAILPNCGNVPVTTDSVTDITGGVTTDGPVTVPVTDAPTTEPSTHCRAIKKWAGLAYMDGWCTFNVFILQLSIVHPNAAFVDMASQPEISKRHCDTSMTTFLLFSIRNKIVIIKLMNTLCVGIFRTFHQISNNEICKVILGSNYLGFNQSLKLWIYNGLFSVCFTRKHVLCIFMPPKGGI